MIRNKMVCSRLWSIQLSHRHSGAIEIFKRKGSLTKLQKAMGHSSLNVSLTYLSGLEDAELKEEDMPMVYFKDGLVKKTYPKNNVKRE
jgi:integrase